MRGHSSRTSPNLDVDRCSGHSFCRYIARCGMLISRCLAVALQWCFEPYVHGRPWSAYARIRSCFARQRNQELARWRAEASVTRGRTRVQDAVQSMCSSLLLLTSEMISCAHASRVCSGTRSLFAGPMLRTTKAVR